ncbi:hypothetical protein B0T17DRAFT_619784 [Bombardia bombarda]|uniref:Oxidase ustYa n=1 Tax=Bombardia bombarda TaxID=252184 RepID=A0AA39WGH4_9PEZI|nr:hypothetical protein B0T17DRAFT_619784 [Bombardia bombarda]
MSPHNEGHRDDDRDSELSELGGLLLDERTESWPNPLGKSLKNWNAHVDDTWKRWKQWAVPALALLFGFALGVVVSTTADLPSHFATSSSSPAVSSKFAFDTPMEFQPNHAYTNTSAPDTATDAAWEALNPGELFSSLGFIQIDEHGQAIAYDGSVGDLSRTKVVSVFHQMHCLDALRRSVVASAASPLEFSYLAPHLSHHWGHCFDYLRQAIMCAADVTLEKLQTGQDRHTLIPGVDGWGTTHMCRNYDLVKQWAETHRSTDEGGID